MHNNSTDKSLIGDRFLFDPYDNSLIDKLENNELIRLGANESRALALLIEEPGAIITRQRLHDHVWREQGFEVDDSSLTQAISTLRKALKDSTKSPAFVKTVPKRGYQMIAPVISYCEIVSAPPSTESNLKEYMGVVESELTVTPSMNAAHILSIQSNSADHEYVLEKRDWKGVLMILIPVLLAIIIPLVVLFTIPPQAATFEPVMTMDGFPIMTTKQNPSLADWKPTITRCVNQYLTEHKNHPRPIKVIVTGGQNDELWLNYIHTKSQSASNNTLNLLSTQKDSVVLCQ